MSGGVVLPAPTGQGLRHLTALGGPGDVVDWRLALTHQALDEAGVLAALPGGAAEIAADLGLQVEPVAAALEVLAGFGVLRRDGATYAYRDETIGDVEREALTQHGVWVRRWAALLGPRLRERGATSPCEPPRPDPGRGSVMLQRASADAVAPVVDLIAPTPGVRVLDLGGGHGGYARELARRGAQVTLQDLPVVVDAVHGDGPTGADGVRLHRQDIDEGLAPGPFDVVLCATVTNMYPPDWVRALLTRIRPILAAGGRLVLVSYLRDRHPVAAVFGVQMLVATPGGDAHGTSAYVDWLAEAGYRGTSVHDLAEPPLSVVIAAAGTSPR